MVVTMPSRLRLALCAAATLVTVLLGAGNAAAPASAAPGDAVSFSVGGSPYLLAQTGTTVTRVFTLLNDGTGSIEFDAPPTLAAPFNVDSSTSMMGQVITPGASASFTVTFTAGTPGTTSVALNLVARASGRTATVTIPLTLTGESTVNTPLHFTVSPKPLTFGTVTVGTPVTRSATVLNDGSVTLRFCTSDVGVYSIAAAPLPGFSVTSPVFGSGCGFVPAGATTTFDVIFDPTMKSEEFAAILRIDGYFVNGDVISAAITDNGFVTGAAVDPVATPTPTPSATSTPTARPTAATPSAANPSVVGAAARSSTPQLAQTGTTAEGVIGFGLLTLALGGIALAITARARRS